MLRDIFTFNQRSIEDYAANRMAGLGLFLLIARAAIRCF
jgi:hypothetical protein